MTSKKNISEFDVNGTLHEKQENGLVKNQTKPILHQTHESTVDYQHASNAELPDREY